MFKNIHWRHYLKFAIGAAGAYAIPATIYLLKANYTQSWLLYLGNFLFLLVIIASLVSFNNHRKKDASAVSMVIAGHITTVTGIVLACLLSFILILILVPGYLGTAKNLMSHVPANTVRDKTHGMSFMLFFNAVVGNMSMGSASSIIFPFSLKRDQTTEKVPPKQAEL